MDMIKPFFPFAFNVKEKDVTSLVVSIIIHLVAGLVVGIVLGIIAGILGGLLPILGWVIGIVGGVFDLYCFAGIVLAVLVFLGMLK